MRQTKRRRTRDAACQTLTYRELRDNANAVPCPQNNPAGWKNSYNSPNRPPHGGGAQWYRHQQRQHQQHQPHHHVAPATRFVSMFNPPPGSPLSSAATASTASVYRIIDGGGVVHGAIVRGGRGGAGSGTGARRKQRPPPQQSRIPSRGNGGNGGGPEAPEGAPADADVFPPRGAHPGEGGSSTVTTTTARPQNRDFSLDGHGALLCSPPPPSPQQDGAQGRRTHEDQGGQDSAQPTAGYPDRRPEITDSQRLSPNVAQVTVSWGGGAQGEGGGGVFQEEEDVSPSTAEHAPEMEVPSYTRGGRGPEAFRGDHETEYQDLVAGLEGPASGAYGGGGGLVYEPPSKGPDYRKVRRNQRKTVSSKGQGIPYVRATALIRKAQYVCSFKCFHTNHLRRTAGVYLMGYCCAEEDPLCISRSPTPFFTHRYSSGSAVHGERHRLPDTETAGCDRRVETIDRY